MIDYARCACDEGWKGTKCELNAAEVFNIASSPSATDTAGMQNVFDDNGILKETVQQAKKMVRTKSTVYVFAFRGNRFTQNLLNTIEKLFSRKELLK